MISSSSSLLEEDRLEISRSLFGSRPANFLPLFSFFALFERFTRCSFAFNPMFLKIDFLITNFLKACLYVELKLIKIYLVEVRVASPSNW